MIHREDRNGIAILRIEHGKVNAIDLEMFEELGRSLEAVQGSSSKAVILTATGRTFSAGVDLFRVLKGGRPYLEKFLPALSGVLQQLFLFPKPVVALVNGNAIAGGCIIACACDYRIAQEGPSKIGVPELRVGVPFPPMPLEIVRFVASPRHLEEIVYLGKYYSLEEARDRGLIDEVLPVEAAWTRAVEIAQELGTIPANTFRITKHQLRRPVMDRVAGGAPAREILEAWSDPASHEVISGYLAKAINKR